MVTRTCVGRMVSSKVKKSPKARKHHRRRQAPRVTAKVPRMKRGGMEKCGLVTGIGGIRYSGDREMFDEVRERNLRDEDDISRSRVSGTCVDWCEGS